MTEPEKFESVEELKEKLKQALEQLTEVKAFLHDYVAPDARLHQIMDKEPGLSLPLKKLNHPGW